MSPEQRLFERLVDERILPPLSWSALTTDEVRAFETAAEEILVDEEDDESDEDNEELNDCLDEVEELASRTKFVSAEELRKIVQHYRRPAEESVG